MPAEGIEPPTFGLQNRCSTAELSRHLVDVSITYESRLMNILATLALTWPNAQALRHLADCLGC